MPENPLVNIGELSRPVTTLFERSSDAVGGLFRPWQIRRVARAEADASMIRAKSEIQITELHQRAFHRFIDEEAAKQTNMENILLKAIPHVDEEKSDPENIETDWLTNFLTSAGSFRMRICSNFGRALSPAKPTIRAHSHEELLTCYQTWISAMRNCSGISAASCGL